MRRVPTDELKHTVELVTQHGRKQAAKLLDLSLQAVTNRVTTAIKQKIPGAEALQSRRDKAKAPAIAQMSEKRDPEPVVQSAPPPAPPTPVKESFYARIDSRKADDLAKPLWEHFIAGGRTNTDVRKQLTEHYLYIVETVVAMLSRSLPPSVDPDDMRTAAAMGLMDATMKYDLSYANTFNTFALPRVRGAVLDFVRQEDPCSRLHRQRINKAKDAADGLRQELQREPTEDELLEQLPEIDTYDKRNQVRHGSPTSLDAPVYEHESARVVNVLDTLEDTSTDPTAVYRQRQLCRVLLRGLEPEEFVIIYLYYFKLKTMKAIGAAIELSESRVSQMHSAVMERLKQCRSFEDVEGLL